MRAAQRTARRWPRAGWVVAAVLALVGMAVGAPPGLTAPRFPTSADEVKYGASVAKQIETHYELVTDPAQVDRITRVGSAVARVVERQDLTYKFLIVSSPGVNSFAVPGGWVYVTEGLMQFVRSDDELAAVLGHELAHINHHDYYIEQARQSAITPELLAALAVSILAANPGPLVAAQMGIQGSLSVYQEDLERNADTTAVSYLMRTSYSPVAMLTVLEHLAQMNLLSGGDALDSYFGITTPEPTRRVANVFAYLQQQRVPIVRRTAEGYLRITLDPPAPGPGQPVTIRVDGRPVLTLAASVDGEPPAQRAQDVVGQLNAFFNTDPAPYDVHVSSLLGQSSVIGGQTILYRVAPEDASYAHAAAPALAAAVREQLAQAIDNAPYNRKI